MNRTSLLRIALVTTLTFSFAANSFAKKLYPLDSIAVIIFGDDSTILIAESEIGRPSIDGTARSFDTIIFEYLVYLDARRMKIMPDQEAIDKHLKAVQRENNLSDEQLKKIFNSAGYTYEEGRMQFELMTTVNTMLDFKIRSRLIVPDSEVKVYFEQHPEIESATYQLERAFINYNSQEEKETLLESLTALSKGKTSKSNLTITWGKPFWIKETDLAENLKFITKLGVGQISTPQEIPDGFELWRLVAKKESHPRTLDERYREISNALKRPRYEELMSQYRKELFDNASIMYLNKDLMPK